MGINTGTSQTWKRKIEVKWQTELVGCAIYSASWRHKSLILQDYKSLALQRGYLYNNHGENNKWFNANKQKNTYQIRTYISILRVILLYIGSPDKHIFLCVFILPIIFTVYITISILWCHNTLLFHLHLLDQTSHIVMFQLNKEVNSNRNSYLEGDRGQNICE